jgi:hypothetical protein
MSAFKSGLAWLDTTKEIGLIISRIIKILGIFETLSVQFIDIYKFNESAALLKYNKTSH